MFVNNGYAREKFHDDYQALEQRLTTLPEHIKHDVMVYSIISLWYNCYISITQVWAAGSSISIIGALFKSFCVLLWENTLVQTLTLCDPHCP